MFNRKENTITDLKSENIELKSRVKELEETICPFNKHDYVIIDTYKNIYCEYGDVKFCSFRILQCKKCKKIIKDDDLYGFKYKVTE
jgi:hypothetical protein